MTDPSVSPEPVPGSGLPGWVRVCLMAVLALTGIFALGATAGVVAVAREDGFDAVTGLLLAVMAGVVAICAWGAWRLFPTLVSEPEAPRVRRSRMLLIVAGAAGGVIGLATSLATDLAGDGTMVGNGPLPPLLALGVIAVYIVIGGGLTLAWLRSIDEHEMQANNAGALAGICAYFVIEPSWWLGWRGGFLPEQQPMITFLVVLAVYTIVWLWRRSH